MKNTIIIAMLACSTCLLSACGGGHNPQSGKSDTVKSSYGNPPDSSKMGSVGTDSMKTDSAKKDSMKK